MQRLESIWQDLPALQSLNYPCCGGTACKPWLPQEGAKPLLNFRGAGVSEDQPSPLPPRQASQAARDRQRTIH